MAIRLEYISVIVRRTTLAQLPDLPVWMADLNPDGGICLAVCWDDAHLFRAEEQTARLVISDWASDHSAGGPEGQELMFNYIQIEPYFEASSR